jgi:hypothetical protein
MICLATHDAHMLWHLRARMMQARQSCACAVTCIVHSGSQRERERERSPTEKKPHTMLSINYYYLL